MQIYRNTVEIKQKESRGRRISLAGLAVLFVGLMSSFVPTWYPPEEPSANALINFVQFNWPYISFGSLFLGFILASIGSHYINRFAVRRWPGTKAVARPDQLVERSMKGFDKKYNLYLYSLPKVGYAISGPCGVVALVPRGDKGKVTVSGSRWREPFSVRRLFTVFAREGIGNPGAELAEQEKALQAMLDEGIEAGHDLADIPVQGAVLFINPEMSIGLDGPDVAVLRTDQMKDHIRRLTKEVRLKGSQVRALNEFLASKAVGGESEEEAEEE
jgi:MFS family permease